MEQDQLIELLKKSLADSHLSRREKRELKHEIAESDLTPELRRRIATTAFELVRESVDHPALQWLNDVVKTAMRAQSEISREPELLFSPKDDCPARIQSLIRNTRSSLDICVFTITDNRISSEIGSAARRGVRVRIISDDDKAEDRGSDVHDLAASGIPVALDREGHMHHKFAIFDKLVSLTGSYNWTRGAAHSNRENILISEDQKIADALSREFNELWRIYGGRPS